MNLHPRLVLPFALVVVALLARTGWQLHVENEQLRAEPSRAAAGTPAPSPEAPAPPPDAAAAQARLAELKQQLQTEIAARSAAEAKATELAKRLPVKEGDVLVSFGRIEQMGQASAKLVSLLASEVGRKMKTGKDLTPEEQREGQEVFQKHLEQITELRRMEDEPREIARYQAATLRELYGFDAATAERVAAFLEPEFARLKTAELTASHRPEKEPTEWDTRRDAAITELAARVRSLLPANHPQLDLLPGVLNLGAGLRSTVHMNADGHGTVQMTLPLFPNTPPL